jgi:hypothetical protein
MWHRIPVQPPSQSPPLITPNLTSASTVCLNLDPRPPLVFAVLLLSAGRYWLLRFNETRKSFYTTLLIFSCSHERSVLRKKGAASKRRWWGGGGGQWQQFNIVPSRRAYTFHDDIQSLLPLFYRTNYIITMSVWVCVIPIQIWSQPSEFPDTS